MLFRSENVYGSLYAIISRCNFVFDYIDQVAESTTDDDQLEKLDNYRGHVYFARALAYSELLKCFCKSYEGDELAANELGVVLRTSYINPEPLKRASLKDSYQFVLDDLQKATDYLTLDDDDASILYNSAYFTIGTVNSLYARLYLYMRKWDKAIEYSSKVIDSKKYFLSNATQKNYSTTYNDFQYMWQYDNATEIIWKVEFETTSYGGALGTVFLNYDYTYYKPDYVPAKWVLDAYATTDLRYDAHFAYSPIEYSIISAGIPSYFTGISATSSPASFSNTRFPFSGFFVYPFSIFGEIVVVLTPATSET